MLELLVNTNDKYSLLNRDNLTQPIQMQISTKQNKNFCFSSMLLNSSLNFRHFEKKDDN